MADLYKKHKDGSLELKESASQVECIEWDENKKPKKIGNLPKVGCSILISSPIARSYSFQDYWLTTQIIEIIEYKLDDYGNPIFYNFQTINSEYILIYDILKYKQLQFPRKVIFLDHDGVICLESEWGSRFKKKENFDDFNPNAIKVLNEILLKTNCEIVVSSDWRRFTDLEKMQDLYEARGVLKKPIGFTEIIKNNKFDYELDRKCEIENWLLKNPSVTNWVAIDDLDMSFDNIKDHFNQDGLKNFVHITSEEGLAQNGVKEKILKFLK